MDMNEEDYTYEMWSAAITRACEASEMLGGMEAAELEVKLVGFARSMIQSGGEDPVSLAAGVLFWAVNCLDEDAVHLIPMVTMVLYRELVARAEGFPSTLFQESP